jgi:hypothetical protein
MAAWGAWIYHISGGDPFGADPAVRAAFPYVRAGLGLATILVVAALLVEAQTSRLEPVAVRLDGDAPAARGSYIGQNGQAVYIARPDTIVGIPNDRVRSVEIGRQQPLTNPDTLAEWVLKELGLNVDYFR